MRARPRLPRPSSRAAERAEVRLRVEQFGALPDGHLVALIAALLGETARRGLAFEVP
ncbi:hypothetical protein AB0M46_38600 [Dactylosporangium sp. NPDC051485]|uniref:hypothetical protein n=1 Tax=Dactylosporangium sp. NPDC051485 TaxID=3154846 RepID=UPI003431DEA7